MARSRGENVGVPQDAHTGRAAGGCHCPSVPWPYHTEAEAKLNRLTGKGTGLSTQAIEELHRRMDAAEAETAELRDLALQIIARLDAEERRTAAA